MELYERMGFEENPFSRFNAEEELEYLSEIFFEPKYFSTILQDIFKNNSRYVFGERGSGKSALMFKIIDELKNKDSLTILIDEYKFLLGKGNNLSWRYCVFLIKTLIRNLLQDMLINNKNINNLNPIEKEKLSFIIKNFFNTISKKEFERFQEIRSFGKIYQEYVNPAVNSILSGVVSFTSDTISKSLGLPSNVEAKFYREYIPSIKLESNEIDFSKITEPELMELFEDLLEIINNLNYKTITFFFDKIDEEQEIAGQIDEETRILLPLLKNNKLLLNQKVCFMFLLWSKVKDSLNINSVRFDKIKPVDVNWTSEELIQIMRRRINYFSSGNASFEGLFQDRDNLDIILKLANKSPRDLLHLMSTIYDQQSEINPGLGLISNLSISRGIIQFLSNYDFYSIYPAQRGTKQDIKGIISKLKKMNKLEFKVRDLATILKVTPKASSSHIKIMRNYGIVKEKEDIAGSEKEYIICDPKIRYIIKNDININ